MSGAALNLDPEDVSVFEQPNLALRTTGLQRCLIWVAVIRLTNSFGHLLDRR